MQRLTDLSITLPRSAWTNEDSNIHKTISNKPSGGWRLIDYVCSEVEGQAIQTSCSDSTEITIPLEQSGWHAISIAMAGHYDQSVIEIRLSNETKWQTLRAGHGDIQEIPWRFSELSQQNIHIRYPRDITQIAGRLRGQALSSRVFWIRLEPLSDEHVQTLKQVDEKPLIYLNDGHSLFWWDAKKADTRAVTQSIRRFADSEWKTCCFCNGGADLVNYPSKVGTRFGQNGWDDPTPNNHKTANIIEQFIQKKEDVLALASDQAHKQKHPFWFYIRPQAWVGEPPYDHAFRSQFFVDNPQFRCLNSRGKAIAKLSYAFPEVRNHINTIIQEGLDRGADAVGIALVRTSPLFYFEQPVREKFKQTYGTNELPTNTDDPRLKRIWNDFFCEWLNEIRTLLKPSQRLFLITAGTQAWHDNFAIDIPRICAEGLIDDILLYPEDAEEIDVDSFKEWAQLNQVKLYPGLGNFRDHGLPVAELQKRALTYYQQGAYGLNRWDTTGSWIGLQLHQPQYLALWQEHYLGEQNLSLQEYAGLYLEEFPPLDGF